MKRIAHILAVALVAVSARAAGGVSRHMDELRLAVGTNGVEAARAAVAGVDWQGVRDPVSELNALKNQVAGHPGFEGVERELKTKLRLLTPGAKMDGGDGTMAVPVAEAPVVGVPGVPIPHLGVSVVSPGSLDIPSGVLTPVSPDALEIPSAARFTEAHGGIFSGVVDPPHYPIRVVDTRIDAFVSERDAWAGRYGRLRRFWNDDGTEFVPDNGTGIQTLMRGMLDDARRFDARIDEYNRRVERVQWRKKMLKGQGVSR